MEYPHNSEADPVDCNGGAPSSVVVQMTSQESLQQQQQQMHIQQQQSHMHHENVVLQLQAQAQQAQQQQHSQHVEVIKTAGHVPPLSHAPLGDQGQHVSIKCELDLQNASMLQEMKNMRMPIYELYQGGMGRATTAAYATNLYEQSPYGSLAALQSAPLQPNYANLLASSVQASAAEYYPTGAGGVTTADYYSRMRPLQPMYSAVETTEELVDRLNRSQMTGGSIFTKPMTVEMPSPVDSGLGNELMITPKQELHENSGFMYTDMHGTLTHAIQQQQQQQPAPHHRVPKESQSPRSSSANDRIVTNRESPVHIPKIESSVGFQYTLEAPVSTSARREDDRLTYMNKGQFYTITLEYIPDQIKPLKSVTVKSIMLVVFREEKTYEDEIKCWQFWHSRQHSSKQRILDVDAKNSTGVAGNIEEVAHNGIAFYWNPTEQPVKVNIGVQCLSTDFSNQKGVKGLPLHIQIDTFDEAYSKSIPFHRGYCQVKVFCDKGANRKMLHEQRRDEKRRLNGRKKTDDEYHEPCDRSCFYHMSNLSKPAVLFVPPEDYDRSFSTSIDFYNIADPATTVSSDSKETLINGDRSITPNAKRKKLDYPANRIMLYVRKQEEEVYTALHLSPPTVQSLINAVSDKYGVKSSQVTGIFRQNLKGYTVKIDDEMLEYYCNEDSFIIQFSLVNDEGEANFNVTLVELDVSRSSPTASPS